MKRLFTVVITLLVVALSIMSCTAAPTATPVSPSPPAPSPTLAPAPPTTSEPAPTPKTAPTPTPAPVLTPTPTPPPDTTPPPAITGLVAVNAYDKRVNVWWDKSAAADFDHYNIYLNKAEMVDVTGMKAIQQIKDIATSRYQATGLDDGTKYYFAVTAVDKSGNEDIKVTSVSATPTPMPKGTKDPNLEVAVYQADRVWAGTTLLPLNYDRQKRRIVEVNMLGEIVWEYVVSGVPENSFVEAELLPNNNILYTVAEKGVYEIDRSGKIVWSYLTSKIDHDADRLPNGNTIFVFGMGDQKSDAQVTEVNPKGQIVWAWYAKNHFNKPPYDSIYDDGWAHTNAVTRLSNGNTFISLRNFNMVVEVDPKGEVIRTIGEGILVDVHDPEILPNGNILGALPVVTNPAHAIEIDPNSNAVVWQFRWPRDLLPQGTRDTNRLPNGNTLITGTTAIAEVTPQGEIIWQLTLKAVIKQEEAKGKGFYKADRISAQK